jgi:hypothetical protein
VYLTFFLQSAFGVSIMRTIASVSGYQRRNTADRAPHALVERPDVPFSNRCIRTYMDHFSAIFTLVRVPLAPCVGSISTFSRRCAWVIVYSHDLSSACCLDSITVQPFWPNAPSKKRRTSSLSLGVCQLVCARTAGRSGAALTSHCCRADGCYITRMILRSE